MMVLDREDIQWLNVVPIPAVFRVRQRFATDHLVQVEQAVADEWRRLELGRQIQPGMRVGIGVGSRGVAAIDRTTAAVVGAIRVAGGEPYIIPAMGSHGGATPKGQEAVLGELGITPRTVGASILASMETREISGIEGMPIHVAETALAVNAMIVINRVKPHTDFRGPIESGLAKLCAIGLGKDQGARLLHARGIHGLRDLMPAVARQVVEHAHVLAGFGIVENAYHQALLIEGLRGDEIGGPREQELLNRARAAMAYLPLRMLDVLVVDRMGKEISGSGLDTNVIGRMEIHGEAEFGDPTIVNIAVLNLTPASQGNAMGIGLADFTTQSLADQIDWRKTYVNTLTSGICAVRRAKLPVVLPDDRSAVRAAIASSGRPDHGRIRLAHVASTLHLDQIEITGNLLDELPSTCEVVQGPTPLRFTGNVLQPCPTTAHGNVSNGID